MHHSTAPSQAFNLSVTDRQQILGIIKVGNKADEMVLNRKILYPAMYSVRQTEVTDPGEQPGGVRARGRAMSIPGRELDEC